MTIAELFNGQLYEANALAEVALTLAKLMNDEFLWKRPALIIENKNNELIELSKNYGKIQTLLLILEEKLRDASSQLNAVMDMNLKGFECSPSENTPQ